MSNSFPSPYDNEKVLTVTKTTIVASNKVKIEMIYVLLKNHDNTHNSI